MGSSGRSLWCEARGQAIDFRTTLIAAYASTHTLGVPVLPGELLRPRDPDRIRPESNLNQLLPRGYVAGDPHSDLYFGAHVMLAAIIALGGAFTGPWMVWIRRVGLGGAPLRPAHRQPRCNPDRVIQDNIQPLDMYVCKKADHYFTLGDIQMYFPFMKRLAATNMALVVFVLAVTAFANSANARDTKSIPQRYSHIQDLNNVGAELIYRGPRKAPQLLQALRELHQSMTAISKLRSRLREDSAFSGRVANRRRDNLRYQADAYAKLGDRKEALTCLEKWAAGSIWANEDQWLIKDKNLAALHDDPRFKALVRRFDNLTARWDASAFQTPAKPLSEAQRIAGLSLFWSEVRYNFAHFDHVPNLDWNRTYLEFLPKVIKAKTLSAYYRVLMRLAPLLHDAHTNIYPPKSIQDQFYASPPIATALVQNRVVITWVADPVLAAKGVRVGDVVLTVDGLTVRQYAKKYVEPYVSSSTPQDLAVRLYDYQLLDGDHTRPVTLGLENASGKKLSVTLSREPDPRAKWRRPFEFRMLPHGIAYLSLGEFANDRGAKIFKEHLSQILSAKGLILDVRANGGGSTNNGLKILSWLTRKPIPRPVMRSPEYIATYRAWDGPSEQWKVLGGAGDTYKQSHDRHFGGPVAVLIGPRTFSAAEDFVVSFVAMKRGILVGRKTAGSSGQPLMLKLPDGGLARICTAQETFPDGRKFVDIGIAPEIKVRQTIADIRAGRDPGLVAAAAALLAEKADQSRRELQ